MKKLLYSLITLTLLCNTNSYSASSGFGIGLLAGISKTKITNISENDKKIAELIIDNCIAYYSYTRNLQIDISSKTSIQETSGFSFDLGATMFYQIGIKNFFIRPGVFCNFPVAKNKFSTLKIDITENIKNIKAICDLPLIHSFDIGGQLLFGYNFAKIFSLVLGGEVGYTKWKWNARAKVSGQENEEDLFSFEKLFVRGIIGCEFNFGNVILGLHAFAGPLKIKGSDYKLNTNLKIDNNIQTSGSVLKLINGGVRLMLAYKF